MKRTQPGFEQAYRTLGRKLLARAPGFDHCSDELLTDLMADAVVLRVAFGQVLMRHGEHADHLLLLVEGVLAARIDISPRKRHLLAFVLPGMMSGYLSLVDEGAQPHDIVAHMPSVVVRIPGAAVRRLSRTHVTLTQALQTQVSVRLRLLYDLYAFSLTYSLRERLARQLVVLADAVGVQHAGGCALEMRISQGDLADLLSVGRQAVNAELSQLQADGLVRVSRSHIDVLDLDALRARIPKGLEAPTQGGHVHTPLGLC